MAGFMAGFGSAFSRSFESARERSAQKEDDLFKIKFKAAVDNKTKIDETKAADLKLTRQAKNMVEVYKVDPSLWPKVREQLASGMSESSVEKWLSENDFTVTNNEPVDPSAPTGVPTANTDQNLPEMAGNSVNAQMTAAGMAKPDDGGIFKGNLGLGLREKTGTRVDNRIMEASGWTPEQLKEYESGVTTEEIPSTDNIQVSWRPKDDPKFWEITGGAEASTKLQLAIDSDDPEKIAKARRIYDSQVTWIGIEANAKATAEKGGPWKPTTAAIRDENGDYVGMAKRLVVDGEIQWIDPVSKERLDPNRVEVFNQDMMKELETIKIETAKESAAYTSRAENLGSVVLLTQEMETLLNENPGAAGWAGSFMGVIDSYARNTSQLLDAFANQANKNLVPMQDKTGNVVNAPRYTLEGLKKISEQEATLANYIRSFTGDQNQKTALAAALLDAKATRMAYSIGVAFGQEGRAVTQEEFKNFKNMALGGPSGNPTAMKQGLADFVLGEYAALKIQESNLNENNGSVRFFEETHNMPSPYKPARDLDTLLESNEAIAKGLDDMRAIGVSASTSNGKISPPEQTQQPVVIGHTPDGKEIIRLPDGREKVR